MTSRLILLKRSNPRLLLNMPKINTHSPQPPSRPKTPGTTEIIMTTLTRLTKTRSRMQSTIRTYAKSKQSGSMNGNTVSNQFNLCSRTARSPNCMVIVDTHQTKSTPSLRKSSPRSTSTKGIGLVLPNMNHIS